MHNRFTTGLGLSSRPSSAARARVFISGVALEIETLILFAQSPSCSLMIAGAAIVTTQADRGHPKVSMSCLRRVWSASLIRRRPPYLLSHPTLAFLGERARSSTAPYGPCLHPPVLGAISPTVSRPRKAVLSALSCSPSPIPDGVRGDAESRTPPSRGRSRDQHRLLALSFIMSFGFLKATSRSSWAALSAHRRAPRRAYTISTWH